MAWREFSGDDQAGIDVIAYYGVIDGQRGRVKPHVASALQQTQEGWTEWFSSQPTSWSLGTVLIFPCSTFFRVTATPETLQLLTIPACLLSQCLCTCCFLYPEFPVPTSLSVSGNPPLPLQMILALCPLSSYLRTCSTVICESYERLSIRIFPGPGMLWLLN